MKVEGEDEEDDGCNDVFASDRFANGERCA